MSLTLKKRYYDNKVRALHDADPHSWWKRTKQFLSTPDSDPLSHLSIDFGQTMAETINYYFVSISPDLPPVDSKILELLKPYTANSEFIEPYQVIQLDSPNSIFTPRLKKLCKIVFVRTSSNFHQF